MQNEKKKSKSICPWKHIILKFIGQGINGFDDEEQRKLQK
jgi:hypothetical protein